MQAKYLLHSADSLMMTDAGLTSTALQVQLNASNKKP